MTHEDPVRRYLKGRRARPDLSEGGLEGLVDRWEQIVEHVAQGYDLTLDDYRNDMDIRDLIAGALDTAGPDVPRAALQRLAAADRRLRALTVASRSIWSDSDGEEGQLDGNAYWWHFARPRVPGPTLAKDLAKL
jgi:hypothetical protein